MSDRIWVGEPIAAERDVSVQLKTGAGVLVGGVLNANVTIKIAKPGGNLVTDAVCTLTEVTGGTVVGQYRLRLSPDAASVEGEVEYEISDATGTGVFTAVQGYVTVRPLDVQYYGQAAGGGTSYIVLDATAVNADGYYASLLSPSTALIVDGKGKGQARIANGYTGANQQLAVTPNWSVGFEPDNTSVVKVIPIAGGGSGGGGGTATVDNAAIAAAVMNYVLDPKAPLHFQTVAHLFNVLMSWLAGVGTGFPPTVQQQLAYQSVGDTTKTRLAGAISGGARTIDTVDGT